MVDHSQQQLTAREMVRAHAYPVLAAVSSLSLSIRGSADPASGQNPSLQPLHRCTDQPAADAASILPRNQMPQEVFQQWFNGEPAR